MRTFEPRSRAGSLVRDEAAGVEGDAQLLKVAVVIDVIAVIVGVGIGIGAVGAATCMCLFGWIGNCPGNVALPILSNKAGVAIPCVGYASIVVVPATITAPTP